ncbi:hypothetical protein [Kineococcus glutinatus]|uniref:Uncharacterized protein n=1 Tax=Kineococcus glutinatus TaxID=1070872 RepID=A0ABP9I201_9ACTN
MSGTTAVDTLPATQHLVMSVLAARHASGQATWEFRSKEAKPLRELAALGLLELLPATAARTLPVRLTPAGAAAVAAAAPDDDTAAAAPADDTATVGPAAQDAPVAPQETGPASADDVERVRALVGGYVGAIDAGSDPAGVEVRRTVAVHEREGHLELDVEVLHVVDGTAHVSIEWSVGLLQELTDLLQQHGFALLPHTAARISRQG